ncbi:MAG: uncharacterized protein A8A55_1936, partial [Amphiamblys sp. WSBS2006]
MFGMDEYRKTIRGSEEGEIRISALVAQLQAPASFSLTHDLPNETVLLTDQTTVTLSNIEISVELFFVLLRKTRVTIEEAFSITEYVDNEDCIREHGMARNRPFCLERSLAVSSLALENIGRMPPSSIGCSLEVFDLSDTWLINILPKLRVHEDYGLDISVYIQAMKNTSLEYSNKRNLFVLGRVKSMDLGGYAVSFITEMRIKKGNTMETFVLIECGCDFPRILGEGDNSI